jgi:hypothetical protein
MQVIELYNANTSRCSMILLIVLEKNYINFLKLKDMHWWYTTVEKEKLSDNTLKPDAKNA